ncbi:unnamed protein product [Bursaphelenchus okinawaensis]|uniref:Major sperm protein n=1 Tax=Bursaphelenchus okinawaensis TaxID=465554 RepID=A0A811L7F1_9BILA|nr:unnamed protein product [Bursaphelenchus okinawaensis]CAG9118331.1 unnamed protein product [Bursaphelenchus okinawaensis]
MFEVPEWVWRMIGWKFFARCLSCRRDLPNDNSSLSSLSVSSSSTSLNTAVDESFIRIKLLTECNGQLCLRIQNDHPVNWLAGRLGAKSKRIKFYPNVFILPPDRSSTFHVTVSTHPYQVDEEKVKAGTLSRFISKAKFSSKVILVYFWLGMEPPDRNPETCWRQPFLVPLEDREHIVFKLPLLE